MSFAKKASDHVPYAQDQGLKYLSGAAKAGVTVIPLLITQSGAAPLVVTFASLDLPNMADADYVVITSGETASVTTVDESTKTVSGFNVLGGLNTEIHNIVVIGRVSGQAA